MNKCFVIQPFDGSEFDARYEDVVVPAIKQVDLEPYRVDRDPKVEIPINEIESGIKAARVCIADVTTNNPNVWFELGYAIAQQKQVVLICSEERETRFPFDIQHRTVTTYKTGSRRDFDKLEESLAARLRGILKKQEQIQDSLRSPITPSEGLEPHEVVALVSVMQNQLNPDSVVTGRDVRSDMDASGYNDLAVTLGLRNLMRKNLIEMIEKEYEHEIYSGYSVTSEGERWLLSNQDRVSLKKPPEENYDLPF